MKPVLTNVYLSAYGSRCRLLFLLLFLPSSESCCLARRVVAEDFCFEGVHKTLYGVLSRCDQ